MAAIMAISSIPVSHSSLPRNQSADHTPGLSMVSVHLSMSLQSRSQHPVPLAAGWHKWKQGLTRLPIQNTGIEKTVEKQRKGR